MGVNKVILIGNLGKDPEVRYTTDKIAVATLAVATNERKKDASGTWVNHTEWHRVVCFDKIAERAKEYLTKGRQVYIEGRLRTNKWQDKEGKDNYTTEIVVSSLEFLGAKPNTISEQDVGVTYEEVAKDISDRMSSPSFDDDDIPF